MDFNLRAAGFETSLATTGEQALIALKQHVPDLVLLELTLPDISGMELCQRIKAEPRTKHVPVVMLTARGEEVHRVAAFEVGADDRVTNPFSTREPVLRVRAVLRRVGAPRASETPPEEVGPIRVDIDAHHVFVHGAEIQLTPLEFKLLTTFMARLGRVQSREQLLEDV